MFDFFILCKLTFSTAHTHTHTCFFLLTLPRSHSGPKLCAIRSHLSRFWHLFSLYFTLSLAVLKIVFHIRARRNEFQHLFYHDRNGVLGTHHQQCQKQSPVKSVTCHMPIIKPSILYICVCNNFLAGIFGEILLSERKMLVCATQWILWQFEAKYFPVQDGFARVTCVNLNFIQISNILTFI